MKTDVVIIGAGIVGCATAYYLAKKGIRSLVLEKDPGAGLQASGRNAGGVRQHGRKAILPLAMASVRLWGTLAEELQCDLEYIRTGNLNVAVDGPTVEAFEREAAWEHQHGLEVSLLTAAECQAMVPGLSKVVAGKFCPSDGVANPMLVTPAFARAGRKLGVNFQFNTPVTGLLKQGSTIRGVKTEAEEVEAPVVINTAGPWAAQFNAQAGCPTPIYPGRSQILITERLPRQYIRSWFSIRGFGYIRPTVSGNLVMGTGGARNDGYSQHFDYRAAQKQADYWCGVLPWLRDISIVRAFSGITEYTPGAEPYIGAVNAAPGLFVAAGFSGEGFCPAPLVGKIMADFILGKEPQISLADFRPDRFVTRINAGQPLPAVVYPLDKMFSGSLAEADLQEFEA